MWSQLSSQRVFNFADPKASDKLVFSVIAHSLARLPRFLGHTRIRWSVAAHTLLVRDIGMCLLTSDEDQIYSAPYLLLHDAHEALIGDIPAPFKQYLKHHHGLDINTLEDQLQFRIREDLNLPAKPRAFVKDLIREADLIALKLERDAFMYSKHEWEVDRLHIPTCVQVRFLTSTAPANQTRILMTEFSNAVRAFNAR